MPRNANTSVQVDIRNTGGGSEVNLGPRSTDIQVGGGAQVGNIGGWVSQVDASQVVPVTEEAPSTSYWQPQQTSYEAPVMDTNVAEAMTQAEPQETQVVQRQDGLHGQATAAPTAAAQASGLKPMEHAEQETRAVQTAQTYNPKMPIADASPIDDLGVASSRTSGRTGADLLGSLLDADDEITKELNASYGYGPRESGRNVPYITPYEADTWVEANNSEPSQLERALRRTDSRTETQQITDDKPDSIFNRPFGYEGGKSRVPRTKQPTLKRISEVIKKAKRSAANAFKLSGVGYRIYGKMLANTHLGFQDVGVGIQEVIAAARQDPRMLNRLLNTYSKEEVDVEQMTTGEIAAYINTHEIYVGTFKPPNNRGQDIQRRRLRVMMTQQRGIYLHPIMAAMYTADFDGDDMEISFDPRVAKYARDPMDYMVGVDDEHSLNMDFLPVSKILDMKDMSAEKYVRVVMLKSLGSYDATPLVKAVMKLSETADSDDKEQSKAYRNIFRVAREVADGAANGNARLSNRIMSRLCEDIYSNMKQIQVQNTLTTIGADNLPDVGLRSYNDNAIIKLIDDMVDGEVPNNFQDLKVMLSGFIGNVEGKNAPFRFTADVGKMVKMDSRLQIGDGSFEVDPNNNEQMLMFFESTVKFAASERMAKEVKKAGRSQYYTQLLREKVINEVKFPEDYNSFQEFLEKFREVYTRESAIINQANLVFLTNMGISNNSNGLVSPIHESDGGMTIGDLAEPMLSIYGTYSIGRIFQELSNVAMAPSNVDELWQGNPNVITDAGRRGSDTSHPVEREYDTSSSRGFWITGKYFSYSLHQFKNRNRIARGDVKKYVNYKISSVQHLSSSDAQFYMLMAIADKRTSSASAFNKKVYGDAGMSEEGARNKRKSNKEGEKTLVKMMSDLLAELDRLDKQGNIVVQAGNDGKSFVLKDGESWHSFSSGFDVEFSYRKKGAGDAVERQIFFETEKKANDYITRLGQWAADNRIELYASIHNSNGHSMLTVATNTNRGKYIAFAAAVDSKSLSGLRSWRIANESTDNPLPSDFSEWEKSVLNNGKQRAKEVVPRDQMRWVEDVINTLIMSGPDMFMHFNMDSPAGFLASKWARKLVENADNQEVLGGIRTAMIFDYRMAHINKLLEAMPDANDDVIGYADAYNNLLFAKDELAASSEVWHGIIQEFMAEASKGQKSVFQMMRENANLPVDQRLTRRSLDNSRTYNWKVAYDAGSFWANDTEHDTLRSVIDDLNMDRLTKWNIIADVVRYWENDAYLKSWEVGYQMEIGDDSSFNLYGGAMQSALGTFNDFSESYTRWGKTNQAAMQENIDDAFKKYNSIDKEGNKPNRGRLMFTLRRLDSAPWEFVEIDDDMYADSIVSVLDKTYAQTEKASQHPWTNAIYAALSYQRNGGYKNDIWRTDDRALGVQSVEDISIQDIIHLLSNPEAELYVYNKYGELAVISRDILLMNALGRELSNDIEEDIWQFLKQEPRVASVVRKHSACVVADSDGTGYLGASLSTTETITNATESAIDPLGHVKYLMRDHPVYAAIISMACPAKGAVTRNHRRRIAQMENYFAYQIYNYAFSPMSSQGSAEAILKDFGITEDSLKDAMRSDYDKFLEMQGLPATYDNGESGTDYDNGESDADASFTYKVAAKNLTGYIDEVRKNVLPVQQLPSTPRRPKNVGVDISSIASFWDVCQELGGAKTSVSTGVEGAETYQFAEWASHITARDKYADLEAVFEDVDQSWNGLWTNAVNEDGTPMLLQVSEDGTIENYRQLMDAKKSQKLSEIVTATPEGYQVKDRSTDTSGTQVASLFIYMVSKRSNGAEAFNLKAKKAGLDGKDSITKMKNKYRMVTRKDPKTGEDRLYRASYADTLYELRQAAESGGIQSARMRLAEILQQENHELGYDDMTLSNYMSIAEIMLIESETGELCLRSLEMLFSAIKHRLGTRIDEMSDKDIRKEADAIVQDASETGVGIATMEPLDVLDGIEPKRVSSSTSGIKPNASVFARNYDLLTQIKEKASEKYHVEPLNPTEATQLTNRFTDIEQIGGMIKSLDVARNYNIIGHAGFNGLDEEVHWTVGPENAIVIGDGDISSERVAQICRNAYVYGLTVFVSESNVSKIPISVSADAVPCSDTGDAMLPFFDIRLNGSEAKPYNGGRFAIFQAPFSRYVVSVEDSINEYELGDAQARPTRRFVDRIKNVWNGSQKITAESLFPNVFRNPAYKNSDTLITFASGNEIERLIADGVKCTIDYGVVEGGNGFEQRKHDVDEAIKRYQQRYQEANADGMMMNSECEPGDIVAWAEVQITNEYDDSIEYVLAPIIPFPLHGPTKGIPEKFSVQQVATTDSDNTLFSVNWTDVSDITNGFAKYFDSSGGANKGMMDFMDAIEDDLLLRDGTPVDAYIAKASTDSRKIGTDRRIKTMISLMALARMHGYNFANVEGSFPENPELREALQRGRVSTTQWKQLIGEGKELVFIDTNPRLNAFLNYECQKVLKNGGNPTDYLMNTYTDEDGNEYNTHVMWEFEAMFDQGLNYEDCLLRFLHTMDPKFCPNGIDDMGDYTFRLAREGNDLAKGYNSGVLQMQVPHRLADGRTAYLWDNVYIGMSFFGEDYSGFSRPNINGASNFLDGMNTMSYYGVELDKKSAHYRAMWATADIGRIPKDGGAIGRP